MKRNEMDLQKDLIAIVDLMNLSPDVRNMAIQFARALTPHVWKMIKEEVQLERMRKTETA